MRDAAVTEVVTEEKALRERRESLAGGLGNVGLNGAGRRKRDVPHLLYPLSDFYAEAGRALPPAEELVGEAVPEPYRRLLVHASDMTPTLETFHGERIHLRPLQRRLAGDTLCRQVVLTLDESLRPVEYGAIAIHLQHFPAEARDLIVESRCPLGTILARYHIEHSSHPQAFFRVTADDFMNQALGMTGREALYGRRNILLAPGDRVLADVLEILPRLEVGS